MSYGFRIGSDIKQETVTLAIETAEQYYLKPSLDADVYNAIRELSDTAVLLAGGLYVNEDGDSFFIVGLKKALAFIAYGELLRMNINATTFGSVQKNDEYSQNVDPSKQIQYFVTVGLQYMREACEAAGYKIHGQTGVARETYYTRRKEDTAWR